MEDEKPKVSPDEYQNLNKELIPILEKLDELHFGKLPHFEFMRPEELNTLTFDEKAQFVRHFLLLTGTVLYDEEGVFEARVMLDDKKSEESKKRPLAYIKFNDGINARVEVIDILESVREDATAIGHPVIVFAIQHWQNLLIWEKFSKSDDVYSKEEFYQKDNYENTEIFIESARENLTALGAALLEGARRQAVPKEYALALKIKNLKVANKNTYLFVAWERLAAKHIKGTDELGERIEKIKQFLERLPPNPLRKQLDDYPLELQKYKDIDDSAVGIFSVINFLKADGSRFVYDQRSEKSTRVKWTAFQNAFIKWYYNKEASTIKTYLKKAKKQDTEGEPVKPNYWTLEEKRVIQIVYDVLTKPLVKVCEPIECSHIEVAAHQFIELMNRKGG